MKIKNNQIRFAPPKKSEQLLSYIIKYNKQFLITAITGIIFNTAIVLGPIFQGKLLDAAVTSSNTNSLVKAGLQFIGITLSFQIARFFKRYYVRDMANRMSGDMRVGIMEAILSTDLNTIEKQKIGDMMSTTIGDVDIVVEAVRKTITEIWDTGVLMVAYWVTLMIYDVKITLIASIPIPIVIVLAQFMKKIVHSRSKAARKANSKTTTQIRKMISQINILRLYGREEAEIKRLKDKLSDQANKTAVVAVLQNGLAPLYSALATVGIILVVGLGGNRVISGNWTIGTFTAFITMFTALAVRTTTAAKVFNVLQGSNASWERVKGLTTFNKENQISKVEQNKAVHVKGNIQKRLIPLLKSLNINWNNKGVSENLLKDKDPIFFTKVNGIKPKEIKIENLSFKYPTGDLYAIKNLSFSVTAGMIIGITGSVGSGKSALGLALTGLYDYEGKILFDNKELRDIPYDKKLATITYMGHDSFLFSETLENNITWNNINTEKLDKVLTTASLKPDIINFKNGIKTEVGERGTKVSGGQKQRISLARALYKEASIVILDDPFSAVDISTEDNIIQELRKNAQGRTIFIFSHRLEAFKYTDRVLVLDKGQIVQEGTHQQLSSVNGIYNKIINLQTFLGGVN